MTEPREDLPQPGEPTMDLLHPEVRGVVDGLRWLWRRRRAAAPSGPQEGEADE